MKKITLLICLFFVSLIHAQESKTGYYITDNDQRIEGAFLVTDYLNPATLKFKKASGSEFEKLDTNNVKEYGIGQDYKSVKYTVQIDATDASEGQLSSNKDATWKKETLFLNVLVEGDATLYSYTTTKGTKFFYEIKSKNIDVQQLLYRKYSATSLSSSENNRFRQQLFNDLTCPEHENQMNDFLTIRYHKEDLMPTFKKYNDCVKSKELVYSNDNGKKTKVFISAFAGAYLSRFNVNGINPEVDNKNKTAFGIGAEFAVVFPSEKLGMFARVEYEKLKSDITSVYQSPYGSTQTINKYMIDANLINFYLGPRYFFNIAPKQKLYIDAAALITLAHGNLKHYVGAHTTNGTIEDTFEDETPISSTISFNAGVGYSFNKFSVEFRVDANRNLFSNTQTHYKFIFGRTGINLKYTFN